VKCSVCGELIGGTGFVISYVATNDTYTATAHMECFEIRIGAGVARKLRNMAFDSGWIQTGLPLLRE